MKNTYYTLIFMAIFASAQAIDSKKNSNAIINSSDNSITSAPNIQLLLKNESQSLSKKFPYRMNLLTQGSIDKNKAGMRMSESAQQFFVDNSGLIFFYELFDNSMRVPHWHANAIEIGTVLQGKMRITIWDGDGSAKVFTVEKNCTWIIPKATLHALENVGSEQMNFIVAYDSPYAADRDFLTAWAALPNGILARAVGLSEKEVSSIKHTTVNRLSKYDPSATPEKIVENGSFKSSFLTTKPIYNTGLGSITRIDSSTNPNMNAMAFQRTILKPGSLRAPHWYTSGDVLMYVYKGVAFYTMMDSDGKVYNAIIKPGDIISIPAGTFHSFLNIGTADLEIYESFNNAKNIEEITLVNGAKHLSTGMIEGATGLSGKTVAKIKNNNESLSYIIAY